MDEQKNEERYKPIQFYVSERQKAEIEEYCKIARASKSEFIRQAIFDKIMRMKYPELFETKISEVSKNMMREMLESITKNTEKINLLLEKMDLALETNKYLEILSKRINRDSLKKINEQLGPLFKNKKSWKIGDLAEELGYSEDDIIKAVSLGNYRIDINGRVKKNE
ncbi:MAG: plasmid mobilization protein [Promethearchaeota archaeon]